jgi:hypothetical protein
MAMCCFSLVNDRDAGITLDPEVALRETNRKFHRAAIPVHRAASGPERDLKELDIG